MEERESDDWGERGWEGGWSGEGVREERMRKGMDGEKYTVTKGEDQSGKGR